MSCFVHPSWVGFCIVCDVGWGVGGYDKLVWICCSWGNVFYVCCVSLVVHFAFVFCLGPTPQDEPISDALVVGLDIAQRPNHAYRTAEPLVAFLQHGQPMNETEVLGSLKNTINNNVAALQMKDTVLVEWMRHICRHKVNLKFPEVMKAAGGYQQTHHMFAFVCKF